MALRYRGPPKDDILFLSGNRPGLLDPTQPARVQRAPAVSDLHFACFDSSAGINQPLSLITRHRIVIEHINGLPLLWRHIPSAIIVDDQEGLHYDTFYEGTFPAIVNICGRLYYCSQEQWDIYKLDPLYECFVWINKPYYPTIKKRIQIQPLHEASGTPSPMSTDDEFDNDPMEIDDSPPNASPSHTHKPHDENPREKKRYDFTIEESPEQAESKSRRRTAHESFQGLRGEDLENLDPKEDFKRNTLFYSPKQQKRQRTLSPRSKLRSLHAKKSDRKFSKDKKWANIIKMRKQKQDWEVYAEILREYAQGEGMPNVPEEHEAEDTRLTSKSPTPPLSEEDHSEALLESIKKMIKLNLDEQLSQAERKKQKEQEGKVEAEDTAKANEEARLRVEVERLERAKREERAKQEEAIRQQQNRILRERVQFHKQWQTGVWNAVRAIERYKLLKAFFDKTKNSHQILALTTLDIPWPSLRHPSHSSAQDVTWDSVTNFFDHVRLAGGWKEHESLVKDAVLRFHPDKWSRLKFNSGQEEIVTAVRIVSQAVNALYDDVKSSR